MSIRWTGLMLAGSMVMLGSGCGNLLYRVGIPLFYEEAELPASQVLLDVPYRDGPGSDPVKHRLDLFLPAPPPDIGASPAGVPAPILVFVHGGGWKTGDKSFRPGGYDVYSNIGRFFAARGIVVAVVSYRLMPEVDWSEQVDDVAAAVAWLHENAARYGANPGEVFLSGHSAGAQLSAWVALDRSRLESRGVPATVVRGLIAVSGAGYDLSDPETYRLGADLDYYEERFRRGDSTDAWSRDASPIRFARADAPPSLVLFASGESEALKHQARIFHEALARAGAESRLVEVPSGSHERIVLTLSRNDRVAGPEILAFIRACADRAPWP